MEIVYKQEKIVRFDEVDFGQCFYVIRGIPLMKIENCYSEENINDFKNSVELETGKLKYFFPADVVIPIKVTGYVAEEVSKNVKDNTI